MVRKIINPSKKVKVAAVVNNSVFTNKINKNNSDNPNNHGDYHDYIAKNTEAVTNKKFKNQKNSSKKFNYAV